jgi:hypothetical protein
MAPGTSSLRFERIVRHPLAAPPDSISKQNAMSIYTYESQRIL